MIEFTLMIIKKPNNSEIGTAFEVLTLPERNTKLVAVMFTKIDKVKTDGDTK